MNEYAAIMPEREIITAAWDIVKRYKDYTATTDEATNAQLLQDMGNLHYMGTPPPKKSWHRGWRTA